MTPEQFKAWFEGFCEAIVEAPTPEQWAKIKAKVADLREKPAVTLRELPPNDFRRQWGDVTCQNDRNAAPLIVRGVGPDVGRITYGSPTGWPMPDRGHSIAKMAGLEPEFGGTRVIDRLTGADLGPSD